MPKVEEMRESGAPALEVERRGASRGRGGTGEGGVDEAAAKRGSHLKTT